MYVYVYTGTWSLQILHILIMYVVNVASCKCVAWPDLNTVPAGELASCEGCDGRSNQPPLLVQSSLLPANIWNLVYQQTLSLSPSKIELLCGWQRVHGITRTHAQPASLLLHFPYHVFQWLPVQKSWFTSRVVSLSCNKTVPVSRVFPVPRIRKGVPIWSCLWKKWWVTGACMHELQFANTPCYFPIIWMSPSCCGYAHLPELFSQSLAILRTT
jgi:hypothetical protein